MRETMSNQTSDSSHPLLSHTDDIAATTADAFLLIGRILIGWLFLVSSAGIGGKLWNNAGFLGYLKNLGAPAPEVSSWIGTRYAALLCALFLIFATALAHRYWEYPAAQVMAQYNNFLKNLAIFGGALLLFVSGPGRFSVDRALSKQG